MHFRMEEKMSKTQPIKDEEMLKNFRNYYRDIEPNPRNYALIVFGLNSALRISDIGTMFIQIKIIAIVNT